MRAYSLSHLSDQTLLRDLTSLIARDRVTTATLLAHLAEVDARRLYLPAAYPSMFAYCVHELHLSEDAASKRIQAARVGRRFPGIFEALADGRLHLTGVGMLAPYLTPENADDLLAAASHRTKAEIEELIAQRSPRSETMALAQALPASPARTAEQLAPAQVESAGPECLGARAGQHAPAHVGPRSKATPVAPERFLLQLTIGQETYDDLRHAQALLGHRIPSGDLARVFGHALKALIGQLEKTKFAATTRPRRNASERPSTNPRHIPARVKRAVWERDSGQCTFVSETGRRCPARKLLEFDHIEEVARRSAEGRRREADEARRRAAGARVVEEAGRKAAEARARAAAEEVITPLRLLGFRADEARRAAALCEPIPDAPIEQRLRRALSCFHRPRTPAQVPTDLGNTP